MNKDEILSAWAPEASLWSPWVKPVLFAHLDAVDRLPPPAAMAPRLHCCPPTADRVAVIVELSGAESALMGVALAELGYRPVPLFNALPLPGDHAILHPFSGRDIAAVDVLPIINALRHGAERLAVLQIPPDAPPAFLLDANRQAAGRVMFEEEFDNRSVCFTTDFPSANFLFAHGIQRAMLVQRSGLGLQSDLRHVLRRWQDGGIKVELAWPDSSVAPVPLDIPKPQWYRVMFQRALLAFGLRRAPAGGFGAWVPESSAGG